MDGTAGGSVGALLIAAAIPAALGAGWAVFLQTPPGRGSFAAFDPDRMGTLETRMWRAYYAKEKRRLFALLILAVREQYRFSWAEASRCAFRLARAAAAFKEIRSGYDRVLADLEAVARHIRDWIGAAADPEAAARAELAWWVARRAPGENSPEQVGRLIGDAYARLYGASNERVLQAGLLRARAAAIRDQSGADAPWDRIEAMLKESYRALRAGLIIKVGFPQA